MAFTPADWYWFVAGATDQVWSSRTRSYVPTTDAGYEAWLAQGNVPTAIGTEADLWDVVCPLKVTNYQARTVMRATPSKMGGASLFADVDAALKAQGGAALDAWEYANEVFRHGQFVAGLAANFGLSDADVRDLFWAAEKVA